MDGRLIFRHHSGRLKPSGRRGGGGRPVRRPSRKGEDVYDSEASEDADEKSRWRTTGMPVLKPTQVGAMKIPRRSGERW
jgi:hypothetical protein